MHMRFVVCSSLILLMSLPAVAGKRRAVTPGDGQRCQFGSILPFMEPVHLTTDATHIYFVPFLVPFPSNFVQRVPKRGGAVESLYTHDLSDAVASLFVDDTTVYVGLIPEVEGTDIPPGKIVAFPKTGGTPRTIATDVKLPNDFATDATHVYWVSGGTFKFLTGTFLSDGKIERARKDGSGRETLAEGLSYPYQLLLDGDTVFFSEIGLAASNPHGGVRRVAKSGGPVVGLTSGWRTVELEQTGGEVVFQAEREDGTDTGIYRMSKNGGTLTPVVLDENLTAEGLRLLGDRVYYISFLEDDQEYFMSVPITGGPPRVVRLADYTWDGDFEVDSCALYYGSNEKFAIVAIPR